MISGQKVLNKCLDKGFHEVYGAKKVKSVQELKVEFERLNGRVVTINDVGHLVNQILASGHAYQFKNELQRLDKLVNVFTDDVKSTKVKFQQAAEKETPKRQSSNRIKKTQTSTAKRKPIANKTSKPQKEIKKKVPVRKLEGLAEVKTSGNGISNDLKEPIENTISRKRPTGVISLDQLRDMDFEKLNFKGEWNEVMQNPYPGFSAMVYGSPKNGKTSFCLQFADYLTFFGTVLYNFADQGISAATKDLIAQTGVQNNPDLDMTQTRKLEELDQIISDGEYSTVFIDLVNNYIDLEKITYMDIDRLMSSHPNVNFILVMGSTKEGNFKGAQEWKHLVDQIIEVKEFKADSHGRLGAGEFIVWKEYWERKSKGDE